LVDIAPPVWTKRFAVLSHGNLITVTGIALTLTDFPSWLEALTWSWTYATDSIIVHTMQNISFISSAITASFLGWKTCIRRDILWELQCSRKREFRHPIHNF